jgi:hypothetical protein
MHMELAVFTLQLYLGLAECFTVELPNVVLLLVQLPFINVGNEVFLAYYTFVAISNDYLLFKIANGQFVFIHLGLESFYLLVLTIEFVLEHFALIVFDQFLALELKLGLYVHFGSWFALLAINVDVFVANQRSHLMLFVVDEQGKNRKDIYNSADFDSQVI